jgi:large subunit ribosomal protein L24
LRLPPAPFAAPPGNLRIPRVQTTLLGLAIAIILALLTALVGPLFVDWERFRPQFEAEATRVIGAPVRVGGAIDLRLLPSPSLILSDIEIGTSAANGAVKARALGVEFALGPLMRGRFRAAQTRIIGPEVTVVLDKDGRVIFPRGFGGASAMDALSIDRLNIDEAKITLVNAATGSRTLLDRFWFHGEVRSLAGAFKGEGAFILNGGLYGYRVTTARPDDTATRIKLSIDPADRPLNVEVDGALTLDNGEPRFDGTLNATRSAGVVLAAGQAVQNEPVRVTARMRANKASALFEQLEFQYGPDERAVKLTGTAELKFGANARFDGLLSGRQLDLDKLASGDLPRQVPLTALRTLKESFGPGLRTSIPARIGVSIDSVTLGGATLQSLRGDLSASASGWSFDRIEFRAPGFTQVQLSGRIDAGAGTTFSGPVDVTTGDPRALLAWLDGRSDLPIAAIKPLRARGEVTLGAETIAVERLHAEIDRKALEGRASYRFATADRRARLDAELRAPALDADAMLDFARTVLGDTKFDRPGELSLALDLGRLTLAGFEAKDAQAKLKFNTDGLQVERLAVADFGGIGLSGSGQIETGGEAPRGSLTLDLDARGWAGVDALAAKFLPQSADDIRRVTSRIGAAKLQASLEVGKEVVGSIPTIATLAIDGNAGALKVNLRARGEGDSKSPGSARVRIDGTLGADDGNALLQALALDGLVAAQGANGELKLQVQGPADGDLNVSARLTLGDLRAESHGTAKIGGDKGVTASASLMVTRGERAALPLPFTLQSRVALAGGAATLSDINASIAKNRLRGRVEIKLARPFVISGRIEADSFDAPALIGAAIGAPAFPADGSWPAEPFVKASLPDLAGRIDIQAAQATFGQGQQVKDLKGALRVSGSEIALEELNGQMAGGRINGSVVFRKIGEAVTAQLRGALKGADARAVLAGGEGGPVAGRLNAQIELEGSGLTPRALIGSLNGTGTVSLEKAEITKLDPRVFASAMRAVDQGMPLDAGRLRDLAGPALDAGRLRMKEAEGAIGVVNGQARLGTVIAHAEGADLAVSGSLDLVTQILDARLVLTATDAPALAGRPELTIALKGPLAAPRRTLDVSTLAGWLALRAVEQQSKKLEQLEAERARPAPPLPAPPLFPASPPAPAASPSASAAPPSPAPRVAPLPPPVDIKPAPRPAAIPRPAPPSMSERDRFFDQFNSQR